MSGSNRENSPGSIIPAFELPEGLSPEFFQNVFIDENSLSLVDKILNNEIKIESGILRRFAVVGFLTERGVELRFKLGLPSNSTPYQVESAQQACAVMGHPDAVVVAKAGSTGIVHEESIKLVLQAEPHLARKKTIGFSFEADKDTLFFFWLNRSAQNLATFVRDPFFLVCALTPAAGADYDNFYHINRSIPHEIFTRLIPAAFQKIKQRFPDEEAKMGYDRDYNFGFEFNWQEHINLPLEERRLFFENLFLKGLYVALERKGALSFKQRPGKCGYEKLLKEGLASARKRNIPIDLNKILEHTTQTPLTLAAAEGFSTVVYWLIENGADINKQDQFGETAIMVAARANNTEMVIKLVKLGANIDLRNSQNLDVFDMLMINNQFEAARMVLKINAARKLAEQKESKEDTSREFSKAIFIFDLIESARSGDTNKIREFLEAPLGSSLTMNEILYALKFIFYDAMLSTNTEMISLVSSYLFQRYAIDSQLDLFENVFLNCLENALKNGSNVLDDILNGQIEGLSSISLSDDFNRKLRVLILKYGSTKNVDDYIRLYDAINLFNVLEIAAEGGNESVVQHLLSTNATMMGQIYKEDNSGLEQHNSYYDGRTQTVKEYFDKILDRKIRKVLANESKETTLSKGEMQHWIQKQFFKVLKNSELPDATDIDLLHKALRYSQVHSLNIDLEYVPDEFRGKFSNIKSVSLIDELLIIGFSKNDLSFVKLIFQYVEMANSLGDEYVWHRSFSKMAIEAQEGLKFIDFVMNRNVVDVKAFLMQEMSGNAKLSLVTLEGLIYSALNFAFENRNYEMMDAIFNSCQSPPGMDTFIRFINDKLPMSESTRFDEYLFSERKAAEPESKGSNGRDLQIREKILIEAAYLGNKSVMMKMLEAGADPWLESSFERSVGLNDARGFNPSFFNSTIINSTANICFQEYSNKVFAEWFPKPVSSGMGLFPEAIELTFDNFKLLSTNELQTAFEKAPFSDQTKRGYFNYFIERYGTEEQAAWLNSYRREGPAALM